MELKKINNSFFKVKGVNDQWAVCSRESAADSRMGIAYFKMVRFFINFMLLFLVLVNIF